MITFYVDIKSEIQREQALPTGQQSNPDFSRIMEAFRMIKDACEKLGTNPNTGQRRDLTDDEISWVVQKIVAGKKGVLHPDNPFLREDEKGDKLELEYVCGSIMEFVKHCDRTRNRDQSIRVEPNIDIFNYKKFIESRPWDKGLVTDDDEKATTDDIMFEKIQGAEAELKHRHPEKYFKVITEILGNKEHSAFPDPNKYHWACQQIKQSCTLAWKITESASDHKQEVVFKTTLGGQEFERTLDFKRQINDQQADTVARQEVPILDADKSLNKPDEDGELLEQAAQKKAKEISLDASVGEKEQIGIRTTAQQKADLADTTNKDFENIKHSLGYDPDNPDHKSFVPANDYDKFVELLLKFKNMPDAKHGLQAKLIEEYTKK